MKNQLLRIIISIVLYAVGIILFEILHINIFWLEVVTFVSAFLIAGYDVVYKAIRNIIRGDFFDENFLMSIATIGAIAIQEFPEAATVMIFYQVGELFQSYAVGKSRKSIAALMDIRPDYANVKDGNIITRKSPEEVKIGDIIVVGAGEKIPLDGIVINGNSSINTSALTGESLPKEVSIDSSVMSGCININGVITIKVEKEFGESTVNQILDLVENAVGKKSSSEDFIRKFARIYTPTVVIIAILLAIIPPLAISGEEFITWLYRALTFLVVSCPCALVVSIPMSFFGGLGGASRNGILIKGSNYLEALAKVDTIVFDKTGTLTKGVFQVQKIESIGINKEELLEYATYAESYSTHPISLSLKKAYEKEIDKSRVKEVNEIAGFGLSAKVDERVVYVGNAKLMAKIGIANLIVDEIGTIVHVAIDEKYAGYILIADQIKEDSYIAIDKLKAVGIKDVVTLTGDAEKVATKVAAELKINKVYSELLPTGKMEKLEEIFKEKRNKGKVAFVGDGINDAPVLARADIGIAMGGIGSDAAIEAADVIIMTDQPSKIAEGKQIAQRTMSIAMQNIIFAIFIKIAVLALSAFGLANMWMAIFADVGVTVLVVLNAFRTLKIKKSKQPFSN